MKENERMRKKCEDKKTNEDRMRERERENKRKGDKTKTKLWAEWSADNRGL
jgi:hypothetical protein